MSNLTIAVILIAAVFAAGIFRAYLDKNISICYLSSIVAFILSISLILNEFGVFYFWMEIIAATLLAVIFSVINEVNKLDNTKRIVN